MAKKKTTVCSANNVGAIPVTHWTTEETSCLLEYFIAHCAEGGDGMGFKQTTFTGASTHMQEPLDGVSNHVAGPSRDSLSCKNNAKYIYTAIVDIKSQSGFSWDDELGANIVPADAACWTAFAKSCPDMKPFRNKGWEHFHEMDELMCTQPSRGTNAFHAGHETFKSEQALSDDGQVNGTPKDTQPVVEDEAEQPGEHVEELERAAGMVSDKEKMVDDREVLVGAEDDNEDDIIPWKMTPVKTIVKRKFRSSTPSLIASGSSTAASGSCPPLKRQRVSGSVGALYAINDQFSAFSDIFQASSQSQSSSSILLSPQHKQAAMRRAQQLETHLDDDSMAALIEAFQVDVSAADAYMVMMDDGPRKSFVGRKIKHINRQVL
ncbi:hypothetical protein DFJ58DRAFT_733419 [Suillus subalutaceus]|uniref:uncharacterized protein n=1 Tax=Suillus subalutaceus TaxID=48586 RepID=UPI001B85C40E|nr:uncharacterized protein DFJ58DRAFT_733419 [Suillus subalutaceus]KAG1839199.1 hypothetical protein DFJ58DRAFT_733419 [Suillus subalutaceus]